MTEIAGALKSDQHADGFFIGEDSPLKKGMRTRVRFDVDSKTKYGVGVVTATSREVKGSHYGNAAHLGVNKDGSPVKAITLNLKRVVALAGGKGKFPIPMAFFDGTWKATSPKTIQSKAEKLEQPQD